MARSTAVLCVLALGIATGCATTASYDPWKVPQDQFRGRIQTIALAPVVLPEGSEDTEAVRARLESALADELRRKGFTIVSSEEVFEVWDRLRRDAGGFYDPITGERDAKKHEVVREHALRELADRHGVDALLHTTVVVVEASYANGTASWWGARQEMASFGGLIVASLVGAETGTISATALRVSIEDTAGVDLYEDGGGIEVLGRLTASGFEARPAEQLYQDEARNRTAVDLALDALPRQTVSAQR